MVRRIPKYSLHKPSGQARVRIGSKSHYLGKFDSPESHAEYERLIAKYLTGGFDADSDSLTIARLALFYSAHAREYYRKDGKPTSEFHCIQSALRPLVRKFGREKASQFGPRKLKTVRDDMIALQWSRSCINGAIHRLNRMLRWGCENELVLPNVYQACRAISGLRLGRSEARETDSIEPVPAHDIKAVEPFVSKEIWAMIQLQLATGARPGEVCTIRTCDIDMTGDVWEYRPQTHKTAHHGRKRLIFIGPRGQAVLRPYISADQSRYLFCPANAEERRSGQRRIDRVSGVTPSQAARTRKANPKRTAGQHYRRDSYSRAITRACELAEISAWAPNRLRHNAATELRKQFGLEGTRVVLGHSNTDMTEVYAELDFDTARKIMRQVG